MDTLRIVSLLPLIYIYDDDLIIFWVGLYFFELFLKMLFAKVKSSSIWKLLWQILFGNLIWQTHFCVIVTMLRSGNSGGTDMANNKHLTLDDRSSIEVGLKEKWNFTKISKNLGKDASTISKEVRNHLSVQRSGGIHLNYNACAHRFSCNKHHICSVCHANRRYKLCKSCSMCNAFCSEFKQVVCPKLSGPPYGCNGGAKR